MKTLFLGMLLLIGLSAFSQKQPKSMTVVIQTSAECDECKTRLEGKLNFTKGVKFAELDVPSKKLTVKFSPKAISLEKIKQIVSDLGYQADEVKANPEAYEKLPSCCKVGGM
ncbi:MAG: heavy-metal-associated domain-containing protein [Fluviicola sp.]|nr:heavy-metal-associated domain-containing protein [Fluviicola sp.]